MKFCPYCGAGLKGSVAYFCPECGEALPEATKPHKPTPEPASIQTHTGKEADPPPHTNTANHAGYRELSRLVMKPSHRNESKKRRRKTVKEPPKLARRPKPDLCDEGYDGYYDDVTPFDNGHIRERTDPELIKRIIFIAAGAFAIIFFSVILMYLL